MISPVAWYLAPLLTFFWVYKGWSFWRAMKVVIPLELIIYATQQGGFAYGLIATLVFSVTFWVYGDAMNENIPLPWVYTVITFLFPLIGLLAYFFARYVYRRSQVEEGEIIQGESGRIIFHDIH